MSKELLLAAQAVLDRWNSPQWEWHKNGPTADLMHDLRAAIAQPNDRWETYEKMPKFDDINQFEVMAQGFLRTVKRIGNNSSSWLKPGTIVFIDCTHPQQTMICDTEHITAWRFKTHDAKPVLPEGEPVQVTPPEEYALYAEGFNEACKPAPRKPITAADITDGMVLAYLDALDTPMNYRATLASAVNAYLNNRGETT